MKQLILILMIPLVWMLCPKAEASIVNDPVALEAKLEQMRLARMAKHQAEEAYWADYRKNYEPTVQTVCKRVYTDKGVYRQCRQILR